jgi:Fe(3+) dicitrate transport protein
MKRLIVIVCLAFAQLVVAQKPKGTIEGYVKCSETLSLENINIEITGTNLGTLTDAKGFFRIDNLVEGKYALVAHAIGYKPETKEVIITGNQTSIVEFELKEKTYDMPQIEVLSVRDRMFQGVPGSVAFIGAKQIEYTAMVSGNEIFRKMPGIHVVDEEGAGLRVNIGVRGLDPDRSRTVLVMEDGVPVALAPYGEPEMYYTPAMDRMSGVEIIKGSGSILFGPQTIGGVINYITADPPEVSKGSVKLRFGEGGFFTGMASYGTAFGNTGIQVNYLRKSANNMGNLMYRINDFSFKLKTRISKKSTIGIKLGIYDEGSNATYVGLTQSMYDAGDMDFVRITPDDLLQIRRYSLSATFEHHFNARLQLKTTAFGYTTTRDWRRQEFSSSAASLKNPTGVVWGDTTIEGGALYMDNRTGNRNRSFEVAGIEPRLSYQFNIKNVKNEMDAGVRFVYERAYEKRIDGEKKDASSGVLKEDEIRTGYATSAYLQNRFQFTNKFSVTAGVRTEIFDYERNILRGKFTINEQAVVRDTNLVSGSNVMAVIPGIGFNYRFVQTICLFGGVHRGFAPPRVKDAISNSGVAMQLDGEYSWNYELGFRSTPLEGLKWELTGFYMDFANQIIPVSESSGGTGSGLVNGGRTIHAGVESGISVDAGKLLSSKYVYRLDVNVTYVHATFNADRFMEDETSNTMMNVKGNATPYAPKLWLSATALFEAPFGLGIQFSGLYVSSQFTDPLNTVTPSADGRNGKLPAYFVLDGTARYTIPKIRTTVSLSVKNMLNERYIASRRPQGIKVGLPRFISAGIDFNF